MSDYGAAIGRGTRFAESALWGCAGIVVLAAHVGGGAWLLREPAMMAVEDVPPAAIMVELAAEPEAVLTETNEIAPDQETAAPILPADVTQDQDAESEDVAERVEPEPVEEAAQADPDEPAPMEEEVEEDVTETVTLPDGVAVPLPVFRPAPPEPRTAASRNSAPKTTEARRPASRSQPQRAAPASASQAQVTQSDRNAGRQSASGATSMSPARWQSRLMAHLERRKQYPSAARSRGEQGTVYVRFSIDASGNVLSVALARSSGFPDLDNEVLSLVRRVSPVPPPPPGVATSVTAPVRFSVR